MGSRTAAPQRNSQEGAQEQQTFAWASLALPAIGIAQVWRVRSRLLGDDVVQYMRQNVRVAIRKSGKQAKSNTASIDQLRAEQCRLQYCLIPIKECLVDVRRSVCGILEILVQLILDVQSSASSHVLAHLVRCSKSFSRARAFVISRSWLRLPGPPKSSTN